MRPFFAKDKNARKKRGPDRPGLAARETIQLFANLIPDIPIGLIVWRLRDTRKPQTMRLIAANPAAAQIVGIAREDLLGKTLPEIFPSWLKSDIPAVLQEMVLSGKAKFFGELSCGEGPDAVRLSSARAFPLPFHCAIMAFLSATQPTPAEQALRESEERYRRFFERNLAGTFRSTLDGTILHCNESFARILGCSSREELLSLHGRDFYFDPADRESLVARLREHKHLTNFEKRLCRKDGSPIWLLENISLVEAEGNSPAVIEGTVLDITERKQTEEALRQLSARLLQSQDEERRRIARELHETTGQTLVALNMNLARVNKAAAQLDAGTRELLAESVALVKQSISEIRTLSYLLHPPLLDEAGLFSALRWYATGFEQRSGIRVDLELPSDFERLPAEVELTFFRLVQECLANVHRHSGSPTAQIRLVRDDSNLLLEVVDQGRGMREGTLNRVLGTGAALGVGIAGMQERVKQLGGRVEIQSGSQGTSVRAYLPSVRGAS
jgi:PAS domain S-box-containing protein